MEIKSRRKVIDFHNRNLIVPPESLTKNPNSINPIIIFRNQVAYPRLSTQDNHLTERASYIPNSPMSSLIVPDFDTGINSYNGSKSVANSRESSPTGKRNLSSRLADIKQCARSSSGKNIGLDEIKSKTFDPSRRKRIIIKSQRTPQSSSTQDRSFGFQNESSKSLSLNKTPNSSTENETEEQNSKEKIKTIFNSHAFNIQPHLQMHAEDDDKEEKKPEKEDRKIILKNNEFTFKLITEDPIKSGINGELRRWKAGETLGHGSFGEVIKAFDVESGQIFAVKRLFFNRENPAKTQFIDTLNREINVLKNLSHKNIVKYLGSEIIKDNFCIYLEYLPGGSIAKLLYNLGPLPEVTVRAYTRQILKGLKYLHANGVVHRDIKGANILLDSEGRVKLSDFGCSRKYESTEAESGLLMSMRGSLPWMAPEVVKQCGHGRMADIWSLGCVVLEMLTAKAPWPDMDNYFATMMKIARTDEIPEIPNNISEYGREFILICLQRDPDNRKSAEELLKHPFILNY
ncbi:unnamed protein product [Blepharisma stoltei]|uniref:Protein kinase domain-containing protein n=1 Tax=Blepharisma stoltei TaxID=1481888 RepID=A0AAU9IV84_9CILI|nr:unnamed protein product [Blepharisma stoltei]